MLLIKLQKVVHSAPKNVPPSPGLSNFNISWRNLAHKNLNATPLPSIESNKGETWRPDPLETNLMDISMSKSEDGELGHESSALTNSRKTIDQSMETESAETLTNHARISPPSSDAQASQPSLLNDHTEPRTKSNNHEEIQCMDDEIVNKILLSLARLNNDKKVAIVHPSFAYQFDETVENWTGGFNPAREYSQM